MGAAACEVCCSGRISRDEITHLMSRSLPTVYGKYLHICIEGERLKKQTAASREWLPF